MNAATPRTRQLVILHLSDIHFGRNHRFDYDESPYGDRPSESDYPTLISKLKQDLAGEDPGCPIIVCLTGDITETADVKEFQAAENFITDLSQADVFGTV